MESEPKTGEDAAALMLMTCQSGQELATAAFGMFDTWRATQPEHVREMDLLDQVLLYSEEMGNG